MMGNAPVIEADSFNRVDATFRQYALRFKNGATFTKNLHPSFAVPAAPANATLALKGGDLEVLDSASGVVLQSPNGTRYRITVDNSGALSTTVVP